MPSSTAALLSLRFGLRGPVPHGVGRLRLRHERDRRGSRTAPPRRRRPGARRRGGRAADLRRRLLLPPSGRDDPHHRRPRGRVPAVRRRPGRLPAGRGGRFRGAAAARRRPGPTRRCWAPSPATEPAPTRTISSHPSRTARARCAACGWRWPMRGSARRVTHINAHGTSTKAGDLAEAAPCPGCSPGRAAGHRREGDDRAHDRRLRRGGGDHDPRSRSGPGSCRRWPAPAGSTPGIGLDVVVGQPRADRRRLRAVELVRVRRRRRLPRPGAAALIRPGPAPPVRERRDVGGEEEPHRRPQLPVVDARRPQLLQPDAETATSDRAGAAIIPQANSYPPPAPRGTARRAGRGTSP